MTDWSLQQLIVIMKSLAECEEGRRFWLQDARWNNACFLRQVVGHAGCLGSVTVPYMCMACGHMLDGDLVWCVLTSMKSCKELSRHRSATSGAKYDNVKALGVSLPCNMAWVTLKERFAALTLRSRVDGVTSSVRLP